MSCCIPDFFTQDKLTLIEKYADLIRLAFSSQEFYPASAIDLAVMPSWKVQKQYFCSFRQRVNDEYKRSLREDQSLQELAQVEARVREVLEGELLSKFAAQMYLDRFAVISLKGAILRLVKVNENGHHLTWAELTCVCSLLACCQLEGLQVRRKAEHESIDITKQCEYTHGKTPPMV